MRSINAKSVVCGVLLCLIVVSCRTEYHGTTQFMGLIVRGAEREPASFAMIEVVGTNLGVIADSLGYFCIDSIPCGKYDLVLETPYSEIRTIKGFEVVSGDVVNIFAMADPRESREPIIYDAVSKEEQERRRKKYEMRWKGWKYLLADRDSIANVQIHLNNYSILTIGGDTLESPNGAYKVWMQIAPETTMRIPFIFTRGPRGLRRTGMSSTGHFRDSLVLVWGPESSRMAFLRTNGPPKPGWKNQARATEVFDLWEGKVLRVPITALIGTVIHIPEKP